MSLVQGSANTAGADIIELITDGACVGNPGPGGWAALLRYRGREKVLMGSVGYTTNNRMELQAALEGLRAIKRSARVRVLTDSQYLQKGMSEWLPRWKARGWRTSDRQPVQNADLWQQLEPMLTQHQIEWCWVRGHAGHVDNERVDELARQAAQQAVKQWGNHAPDRP